MLPEVRLPLLTGADLAGVVRRKTATAGSLDGWVWRKMKVFLEPRFGELARILAVVEEGGIGPECLLYAKIEVDGVPLSVSATSPSFQSFFAFGLLLGWYLEDWFNSWVPESVFSAAGGRGCVEAWKTTALNIEEVLAGAVDSHVHVFVTHVLMFFDTVDRVILDRVLGSLGVPAWFRHASFEFHAHVRLRFKLASGLGEPWTRDGSIPQGCPLSMMFIVALYLPWCRYLGAQYEVEPQL